MLKKLVSLVVLVLWVGYSFSSTKPYYGYTNNAFNYGNPWSMDSVLPDPSGLEINGVFYTYTPIKETGADFEVEIGNWNADKSGYIWKEVDNWDGAPGGIAIIKSIPLPYTLRSLWGDGFLDKTGAGEVTEANVLYSYRVDPCYNPQSNPDCPGFIPPAPPEVDIDELYDATEDAEIEEVKTDNYKESEDEEDSESEEEKEEEERKKRLERAMSTSNSSAMFAEGLAQTLMLQQMNAAINVTVYLKKELPGGTYKETIILEGGNLPDNKNGRRMNWSTQKLHEELVNMQYK